MFRRSLKRKAHTVVMVLAMEEFQDRSLKGLAIHVRINNLGPGRGRFVGEGDVFVWESVKAVPGSMTGEYSSGDCDNSCRDRTMTTVTVRGIDQFSFRQSLKQTCHLLRIGTRPRSVSNISVL
ncbi:hypothetical protein J6590_002976 [Homalodisca vitripennis]|nr:hypothetical protein J6590_002976 [Homalodisca vitripennis]